jgi:branched-chain amino acid transport system substrate-binding protein
MPLKRTGPAGWKAGALPLLGAGVLALSVAACGSSHSNSGSHPTSSSGGSTQITFAGLFDLSGELATYGQSSQQGFQLAAHVINSGGGFTVAGHKYTIKLSIQDGRTDPTASVAATRNFLQAGDKFIFGPDTDATALQVLAATKGQNVLQFAGGSVSQSLIGHAGFETTFGVLSPNSVWQGSVMSVFKALKVPQGNVAIIYPDDTAGQGVAPQFASILKANGYTPKVYLFPATTSDFRSVVARAKTINPVAILDGYTPQWGLPIAQAAVQLNATKAIIGIGQYPDDVPLSIAKSSGAPFPLQWGSLAADQQTAQPTTPGMVKFKQLWTAYFHSPPSTETSNAAMWFYDALLNAVAGMEKAGTVSDVQKIADAIKGTTFDGAETLTYNSTNLPIHGTDYGLLVNNKPKYYYVVPSTS